MGAAWHNTFRTQMAGMTDVYARPHLLCIGGEDHYFRIPMLLALQAKGFRVSAAGPGIRSVRARLPRLSSLPFRPLRRPVFRLGGAADHGAADC